MLHIMLAQLPAAIFKGLSDISAEEFEDRVQLAMKLLFKTGCYVIKKAAYRCTGKTWGGYSQRSWQWAHAWSTRSSRVKTKESRVFCSDLSRIDQSIRTLGQFKKRWEVDSGNFSLLAWFIWDMIVTIYLRPYIRMRLKAISSCCYYPKTSTVA